MPCRGSTIEHRLLDSFYSSFERKSVNLKTAHPSIRLKEHTPALPNLNIYPFLEIEEENINRDGDIENYEDLVATYQKPFDDSLPQSHRIVSVIFFLGKDLKNPPYPPYYMDPLDTTGRYTSSMGLDNRRELAGGKFAMMSYMCIFRIRGNAGQKTKFEGYLPPEDFYYSKGWDKSQCYGPMFQGYNRWKSERMIENSAWDGLRRKGTQRRFVEFRGGGWREALDVLREWDDEQIKEGLF